MGVVPRFNKQADRPVRVLNLFAYTGGATVAALSAGASVTHVDAAKGMVSWAKENVNSSGYKDANIRYIVDDVLKFVAREQRQRQNVRRGVMDRRLTGSAVGRGLED